MATGKRIDRILAHLGAEMRRKSEDILGEPPPQSILEHLRRVARADQTLDEQPSTPVDPDHPAPDDPTKS